MHDPRTFWLTVTNIALGTTLLLLILGVATGVLCEYLARLKKQRDACKEIDRELPGLFHNSGGRRM